MRVGVVITTCTGRESNLARVMDHLEGLVIDRPEALTVVFDGCGVFENLPDITDCNTEFVVIPKHGPGQEQPRNVGFRALTEQNPELTHCWFLDSDMVFFPNLLQFFNEGHALAEDRILIGPYDWMQAGEVNPGGIVGMSDGRWASFEDHGPEHVFRHDLGCGLGMFGGNVIWPVEMFRQSGGFHPNLHHGRCEDGELGLRAASMGFPMSLVREARCWHVWHPIDYQGTLDKNARDVPLLNSYHPWVQDQGFLVSTNDGARFEFQCPEPGCGLQINAYDYYEHVSMHQTGRVPDYKDPASIIQIDA